MVAEFLHQAGYTVGVVNSARIKVFATSRLSARKLTKPMLAGLPCIVNRSDPKLGHRLRLSRRALHAMGRHLHDLKAIRQQEQNRLASSVSAQPAVQTLQPNIAFLGRQSADL